MKALINQSFIRNPALLGLSSLMLLMAIVPASFANASAPTLTISASEPDPSDIEIGLPGRRIGGGTRRDTLFANVSESLVALTTPSALSVTTAAQPVFLFHVPEMTKANNAEFILRDGNDELVYEATFEIAPEAGIVSSAIAQSPDMPALRLNENYQWYFSIYADGADRANDAAVHGSIRRVDQSEWLAQRSVEDASVDNASDLSDRLMAADPLMKAQLLYQEANLWHDAASILHSLREANPEDGAIATEWIQLLESAGIAGLIQPTPSSVQAGLTK